MPDAQDPLSQVSTGEHSFEGTKTVVYPFNNYTVKVLTTLDGKFIGISEISLRKDFLDYRQRLLSATSHDVEKFYKDEDDDA
jgi:hypothetical protein